MTTVLVHLKVDYLGTDRLGDRFHDVRFVHVDPDGPVDPYLSGEVMVTRRMPLHEFRKRGNIEGQRKEAKVSVLTQIVRETSMNRSKKGRTAYRTWHNDEAWDDESRFQGNVLASETPLKVPCERLGAECGHDV